MVDEDAKPKEILNDTLLIVNAIQEQTVILKQSLNEVKDDIKIMKCERCIDKKINFLGKYISVTTILYILTIMNIFIFGYSIGVSPKTIAGILSVL